MTVSGKEYFVLLSTCKIVKGAKRSLLIDYAHDTVYYISNDFYDLIQELRHKDINTSFNELEDDESRKNFEDFLSKMIKKQMAILTKSPECFPSMSEELNDQNVLFQDAIIELDESNFDIKIFETICKKLSDVFCTEWQIRLLSPLNTVFLKNVLETIRNTETQYLEIHIENQNAIQQSEIEKLVKEYAFLSVIYIYGADKVDKINVMSKSKIPLSFGMIYYLNYQYEKGQCCGIICKENLDFTDFYVNHRLKKINGCLYKKVCFDVSGNIKNCPSMKDIFGNILNIDLRKLYENKDFTKLWYINKDKIETCKDCEFRYNCTDCRAFLKTPDNIFSKPAKCSYNPYTCKWL